MDSLSTEECLACLAMYNQQAMFMGDTVWHAPLVDGRVGALLRQIQANA